MASKVIATGRYYDAAISQPERLGFECVEDALQLSLGCAVKTYTEIVSFDEGALAIKDRLTGNTETIRTDLIVNAGGAWIDRINAQIGLNTRYIGGTKGSHLVIDHAELYRELNGQMVYFGTADGRICLAYPFLGHVLVGSTDIPITDPDTVSCSDDEQAYMLRMVRELFPGLTIADRDVIYRYCGVRPLPASATDDPGAISRDHIIHTDYTGTTPVLSLVGGKWTTFRGLAEEVADKTLALLHRKRIASSRHRPIGGGARYPGPRAHDAYLRRLSETHGLSASHARSLFERYGTTAERIAAYCAATPDQPLASLPEYSRNEILYIASQELVRSVDDILFRRTSIALAGHLHQQVVEEICAIVAPHMGWTDQESASQAQTCWNKAKTAHGLRDASAS